MKNHCGVRSTAYNPNNYTDEDGSVVNLANRSAMDIAMARHEKQQEAMIELRALQLKDHLEKVRIDNEIKKREKESKETNQALMYAHLTEYKGEETDQK